MTSENRRTTSDAARSHADLASSANGNGSEERYRLLVEQAVDDFFMHDDKGRFIDVNRRACLNTGYSREELLGMSVLDIATDVTREYAQQVWDNTQPNEYTTAYAHHQRKDGSRFPVEVRISCQIVDGRKVFLGMARDISERVQAERAIHELNAQLRQRVAETTEESRKTANLLQAVMDAAPDLIYVKARDGRYLYVNKADAKLKGLAAGDILGKDDTEIFPIDFAHFLMANDRLVMDGGEARELEEKPVVDGAMRTYLSNKAPYRDEHGQIVGLIGISRDVTDVRRAEAALRRSEARWQFALDGSGDGIWDWDLQTGHVFYSRQWKAMLGYADDDIGTSVEEWSSRVHPDDLPGCRKLVDAHLSGNSLDFVFEHRMRARDGSWRWIFDRGKVIERDTEGNALRMIGTHTDITVRKESENAIRLLNQRLQLANRVSGVGVWELPDPAAGRFYWDEQMHDMYGLDAGTFDGSLDRWIGLLHPDDVAPLIAEWEAALSSPSTTSFLGEFRIFRADGELRHMRTQAQIFRAADGSTQRVLGVNWDITATRHATESMLHAKEAAEAAERAKSEFLAVMSHEIRTPMNTVLGMTRLALQTELAPRQRNYLEKVNAAARTLITIINNVLDFSKIEAKKLELEEAEFALESVLESVSVVTAMKADEKGLEIVYSIAPDVPTRLIGDSLRLGQVLINLVSNAVKFTERGKIVVSIGATSDTRKDRAILQFRVRDTGIGLDAAQIAGLFRPFSQADRHVSRHYGGTGLGLAICKQLVELMGGCIGVISTPGEGSTFEFTVQMRTNAIGAIHVDNVLAARDQNPMPAGAQLPKTVESLAGKRILVVDDNSFNREVAGDFLLAAGMHVDTATDGADALACLGRADYDAVLMDIHMPGMGGLEVAREIRKQERWANLPIIALTARAQPEDREISIRAGMNAHLTKPIDERLLYATLIQVLPISPAAGTARPATANTARKTAGRPPYSQHMDLVAALGHLGDRRELLFRLARSFVQDFREVPAKAMEDLHCGRAEPIAAQAHAVKGAASYLHAATLCATAAQLETAARSGSLDAARLLVTRFVHDLEAVLRELDDVLAREPLASSSTLVHERAAILEPPDTAQLLPTVLIVDDDPLNRELLAELLQNECRVILAGDGASAIARARGEEDIDLILLDVSMPQMDGYEVLGKLRQEPRTGATAVIFITASTDIDDEERGLSLGAMDYLHKPIRPAIVQARVRNHLKLVAQRKELERLADRDGLTGIANRRRFDGAFERAWRRAARTGEPLHVAMIDVDHFKSYNDRYGHSAGDDVLREIAQVLDSAATRPYDLAARYGGEEFILLLSGDIDFAGVLDRLCRDIGALRLVHDDSGIDSPVVTASCGGVTVQAHDLPSPTMLLRQADALLYEAKRLGRNRSVTQRYGGGEQAQA